MKKLLHTLDACNDAKLWAGDKSWKEIYETCHRGDWLLWLFKKTNPNDLQRLTLAKAHCANTVRHLMKREESLNAIDVAIKFGNGLATKEELNAAAVAATTAAVAAATAAVAAATAAVAAADAADAATAATAATAAYAVADAADADDDATKEINQKLTADICRKYLPIEIWNIK